MGRGLEGAVTVIDEHGASLTAGQGLSDSQRCRPTSGRTSPLARSAQREVVRLPGLAQWRSLSALRVCFLAEIIFQFWRECFLINST